MQDLNITKRKYRADTSEHNKKTKSNMSHEEMLKEIAASCKRQEQKLDEICKRQDEQDQRIAKIEEKVDVIRPDILNEVELRIKNRSNIVIYGLVEDAKNDVQVITELLKKIDVSIDVNIDIGKTFRFGSKTGVPKIAKVIFNSEQKATTILKTYERMSVTDRISKLGENIYIEQDLTKTQMAEKRAALLVKNDLNKQGKKSVIRNVNGRFQCVESKK